MLVVGGHTSANTARLAELCAAITLTHLVETAAEIQIAWLRGRAGWVSPRSIYRRGNYRRGGGRLEALAGA